MSEETTPGDLLPPVLSTIDVLAALSIVLSKIPGCDQMTIGRAQAALETKFAEGFRRGCAHGSSGGYQMGYTEGLEDGRREVLDREAAEEARRVTIKAATRRRCG